MVRQITIGLLGILLVSLAHAEVRLVSPQGPYRSVREALARAQAGDEIRIRPGFYAEGELEIRIPGLRLIGEGAPVLSGRSERNVLLIRADDVQVQGLILEGVGTGSLEDFAAIRVEGARRVLLLNNLIRDAYFGIYLARAEEVVVAQNRCYGPAHMESFSGNGIHAWNARYLRIEDNEITAHRDGIYLEFVTDSEIRGNRAYSNVRYGLHFMFSDRCRYEANSFVRNGAGVAVMYSRRVEMRANTFAHNRGATGYGLLLKDISESRIEQNRFLQNTVGLYAEGSNRLLLRGNTWERNGWAVRLLANCTENRFLDNRFVGNSFDLTTNGTRHVGNVFEGNYWSRYVGFDLDRDGYGDVPYRPVRLSAYVLEQAPGALLLLNSFFLQVLELVERILPVFTPEILQDEKPRIRDGGK
nr:MAG: hypothetical protein KatS3mg041_0625 [Bacteroidota bacterium]